MRRCFPILTALMALGGLALPLPGAVAQERMLEGDQGDQAAGVDPARPRQPLDLTIEGGLDFSRLATGSAGGSAQIDPRSGARRIKGDVRPLGGFAYTARVRVVGEPLRAVTVRLPQSVELVSFSGQRVWLRDFETDLDPAPRLDAFGELTFRLGARLDIGPGVSGDLRGHIPIAVEYD